MILHLIFQQNKIFFSSKCRVPFGGYPDYEHSNLFLKGTQLTSPYTARYLLHMGFTYTGHFLIIYLHLN